jgi:hypothetical protein
MGSFQAASADLVPVPYSYRNERTSVWRTRVARLARTGLDAHKLKIRIARSSSHGLLTTVGSALARLDAWEITDMKWGCYRSRYKHKPKYRHGSLPRLQTILLCIIGVRCMGLANDE